jgi:hypothetical protein
MASGLTLSPVPRGAYDPSYAGEGTTAGLNYPALPSSPLERQPQGQGTPFGFDEQRGKVWVNGVEFDKDDHQAALDSKSALDGPQQQMPANFRPMQISEFGGYIQRIKDPSFGRLISKNLGIGVDVSQMLGGSVLRFVGAEETGQAVIDQQIKEMGFSQPYQRTFTDDALESPGGAAEWFVANAAQMAPLMAEMLITSFITGGVGFAAGATRLGAHVLAKGGAKLALKAERKRVAGQAMLGLRRLQGKKGITPTQRYALKRVGAASGARMGATAAAYGVGLGDVYQTVEESGNYDSPTLARIISAIVAVPYARAEVLPAQFAVTTAMRAAARGAGGTPLQRLKRGTGALATGAAAGGGLEGTTEVLQEALALGAAGELDLYDPEVRKQLINAFFAGAGIGAPIGGIANLIRRAPKGIDKPGLELVGTEAEAEAEAGQLELFPDQDLGTAPISLVKGQEQGELFGVSEMGVSPEQAELGAFDRVDAAKRVDTSPTVQDPNQLDLFNQPVVRRRRRRGTSPTVQDPNQLELFREAAEVDAYLREQAPPPASTAMADAIQQAEKSQADARIPGDIAQEAQFQEAAPLQLELPLPEPAMEPVPRGFPAFDAQQAPLARPEPGFQGVPQTGEPTLLVHTRDADGSVVMTPTPVAELLDKSQGEMESLERLAVCLRSKL